MLVFFIHGVATKDAGYSTRLQKLLREEFMKQDEPLPHFYGSFWGNAISDKGRIWNWIHNDLKDFKKDYPQVDVRDVFRYQELREDFISDFFGDILTYTNSECGRDIRGMIAEQLYKFLKAHPHESEFHIVTHSLGSIVLWDVLFSEKFTSDDPVHEIRSMLKLSNRSKDEEKPCLKSITTMGSPILFFNIMLGVQPEQIRTFATNYQPESLRWINIIHSSDVIAYPLQSSMNAKLMPNFFFRDKFIWADANGAERTARRFGQAHAAMAIGMSDAHSSYWSSRGVARLITANILGDCDAIDSAQIDVE